MVNSAIKGFSRQETFGGGGGCCCLPLDVCGGGLPFRGSWGLILLRSQDLVRLGYPGPSRSGQGFDFTNKLFGCLDWGLPNTLSPHPRILKASHIFLVEFISVIMTHPQSNGFWHEAVFGVYLLTVRRGVQPHTEMQQSASYATNILKSQDALVIYYPQSTR